ncbi:histone deacetylase [Kickxella alabastrina]|uniref:Histone deacetylase n=1 Tax=Kickxella alabastrina TaxID=61397 RepID=A0ACC1I6U6_9FUNG|nr:histone deacetylase [Kickxella alabastrina]
MEWYQPDAVVLQCGTDSLAGDKLGCFNLSIDGHAECVRFVRGFNLPTLVLGGGGYTIRNVSRVWAYETGVLVGTEMDRKLPMNDYMDYYAPEYTLNVPAYNVDNANSPEYLDRMRSQVLQNIERTRFAPSVQMQDVPRDVDRDTVDEDALDPDERMPETAREQLVVPDTEMYEADSMGMRDNTRDNTKVVNEETNDTMSVDNDEPSAVHDADADADVEMEDAQPKAEAEAETESEQADDTSSVPAAELMDVDTDDIKPETVSEPVVLEPAEVVKPINLPVVEEVRASPITNLADADTAALDADKPIDSVIVEEPATTTLAAAAPASDTAEVSEVAEAETTADAMDVVDTNEPEIVVDVTADATATADVAVAAETSPDAEVTNVIPVGAAAAPDVTEFDIPVEDAAAPVSVTSVPEVTPVAIDTSSNPASPSSTDAKVEPATKTEISTAEISTAEPSTGVDSAAGETETRNPTTAGVSAKPSLPVAREDGEATEDDYDDEDGEIRDA